MATFFIAAYEIILSLGDRMLAVHCIFIFTVEDSDYSFLFMKMKCQSSYFTRPIHEAFHVNPPSAKFLARV